jgi:hypothetical protein
MTQKQASLWNRSTSDSTKAVGEMSVLSRVEVPSFMEISSLINKLEWEYFVDFHGMTQTNIQHPNHTVRNIRRVQLAA